jgi:TM2 domain-containing membrane protein YozV
MPLVVACPTCGTRLKVPEKFAGREVRCPHCSRSLRARNGPNGANHEEPGGQRLPARTKGDDEVHDVDEYLIREGSPRRKRGRDEKYCQECGAIIRAKAVICPECGVEQAQVEQSFRRPDSNRIAAGICGIVIGSLGIHKFILGLTGPGLTMLLITVCSLFGGLLIAFVTCGLGFPLVGLGPMAMSIIGLIEGIIYLSKSDEEFYRDYVVRKKGWF